MNLTKIYRLWVDTYLGHTTYRDTNLCETKSFGLKLYHMILMRVGLTKQKPCTSNL